MPKKLAAHLSVFALNLLYVFSYFIVKDVSPNHLSASAFVLIRASGATILFWLVALFFRCTKIEKQDHPKLMFAALFGIVFNQLLFFNGLVLTSSVNTSILMTTTPILVLPISAWLLKEKMTPFKIIGVVVGFLGALLIILQKESVIAGNNPALGNILVFINAALFSFYLVYVKPIMIKYSLFEVLKWLFLYGTIVIIPFGLNDFLSIDWTTFTPKVWGAVLYVIFGITFLTFILNMYAIKELSPLAVSIYIFLQPLLTAIVSWFWINETISFVGGMASFLIFIGVYFVAIKKS
jgi:drug/metabolite transporter (DMT)-like permease